MPLKHTSELLVVIMRDMYGLFWVPYTERYEVVSMEQAHTLDQSCLPTTVAVQDHQVMEEYALQLNADIDAIPKHRFLFEREGLLKFVVLPSLVDIDQVRKVFNSQNQWDTLYLALVAKSLVEDIAEKDAGVSGTVHRYSKVHALLSQEHVYADLYDVDSGFDDLYKVATYVHTYNGAH